MAVQTVLVTGSAARQGGVRRVIRASTGQIFRGRRGSFPVRPETPASPCSWYATTKVLAEAVAHGYAHGLEVFVICCRWCPGSPEQVRELERSPYGRASYLSPGDAGRCFAAAVEIHRVPRFTVVHATSLPVGPPRYDLGPARELLGYEPRDRWPEGLDLATGGGVMQGTPP